MVSIVDREPGSGPDLVAGDILSIRQLSEYLMVSEKTIYRMLERNRLPAVRIGAQWRFRKRDIDAWLDEQVRRVEVEKASFEELEPAEIDLHPLLAPENVWLDAPAAPRDELIRWMVDRATLDPGVDREALAASIRARENVCSTALVKGAAFPHPNEQSAFRFSKKRVLLAVAREPVDFHDPHGHRPRLVVVILARSVQGYLHAISRAVKLFGSASLVGRILKASSAAEVIAAIRDAEQRLGAR